MSVPFGSFGFKVKLTIGGLSSENLGLFQEVSGLSASINVTDLVEGGVNYTTHKLLGNASYGNVTLKRGLCSVSMFSWIQDVISKLGASSIQRQNASIEILGDDGKTVGTYKLIRVVPVKWDGPSLSVMQDGIATESLELAHGGLSFEAAQK